MEASKLTLLRSLASELVYEYLDDIDIHGGIYKPILTSLIKRLISLFFILNNYKHKRKIQEQLPKFTVTEPPIGYPLIFPHVTHRMRFCNIRISHESGYQRYASSSRDGAPHAFVLNELTTTTSKQTIN